jgi:predicted ArsR family transcriptional regulator
MKGRVMFTVYHWLRQHPASTPDEIADAFGKHKVWARSHLQNLEFKKMVQKQNDQWSAV